MCGCVGGVVPRGHRVYTQPCHQSHSSRPWFRCVSVRCNYVKRQKAHVYDIVHEICRMFNLFVIQSTLEESCDPFTHILRSHFTGIRIIAASPQSLQCMWSEDQGQMRHHEPCTKYLGRIAYKETVSIQGAQNAWYGSHYRRYRTVIIVFQS